MTGTVDRESHSPVRLGLLLIPLLVLLVLAACGGGPQSTPSPAWPPPRPSQSAPTAVVPGVEVSLSEKDISVKPLPLQAGFPFTVTLALHNEGDSASPPLPVMLYIAPDLEEIGYTPFVEVLTVTLPSTLPVSIQIPVHWNFRGGQHRLWAQVNRLPAGWQAPVQTWPEQDRSDNVALLELMVEPFDAYRSELCPGRVDLELAASAVAAEPGAERVRVRVRNVGNQAAYNLPVVVSGDELSGIAYSPAIPPCGGTTDVWVWVDRPLVEGESIAVALNPEGWEGGLVEDDFGNNHAGALVARPAGEASMPEPVDYDFALAPADVESPAQWLVLVTVHNLGTRDAARVPIRVENQAGRKVNDVIPLVQGTGAGVAAIRVGTLWSRGGVLTLTVNPAGAKGALPESDRSNNSASFSLP